jgi:NAD(P)-dependent dehydrogenase (short-subunit alcohol dehydrogenase family)
MSMTFVTSPFGYRSTPLEVAKGHDRSGRTALVTGAASGIGLETARALASTGARVLLAVRDLGRGSQARATIHETHPDAELDVLSLDLGSLGSVQALATEIERRHDRIDILVNNAGVMATPFGHTVEGFELQFGTNHVGHFALFQRLLPLLGAAPSPRIVALSSIGHQRSAVDFDDPNFKSRPYDKWTAYGQSKTACALFAVGVAQHSGLSTASAFAVHPGGIMTGLQKFLPEEEVRAFGWVNDVGEVNERFKTLEQGASTSVWAALGTELEGRNGLYLEDCRQAEPWTKDRPMMGAKDYAIDPVIAERLWAMTTEMVSAHL